MVLETIHTPITEGTGNSGRVGVGGSKAQEILERRGGGRGLSVKLHFQIVKNSLLTYFADILHRKIVA